MTNQDRDVMYEQLAWESAELCKNALKMARIIRGENSELVTGAQAWKDLQETYTNVVICSDEIGLLYDAKLAKRKKRELVNKING